MTAPTPVVLDLAGEVFASDVRQSLERADNDAPVAVIVPAWFGMADRHQVMCYLDPNGTRSLQLVSSALAGVYGRYSHRGARRSRAPVLVLDVRSGWSAGLIHLAPDGPIEVAAWGIAPHEVASRLDDEVVCPWLVDHLFTAAAGIEGTDSIRAVVVVDDVRKRSKLVNDAVRRSDHPLAGCPVLAESSKQLMAGGAALFGQLSGAPRSVGALAHALAVRADGDPERVAMHIVAAEHASFPSTTRQMFELGPDDGAPLHFDIYEQHRSSPGDGEVDHTVVVRAHLVRERGYDQRMMITFELGSNGVLSIGPANAWRLDWQPGSLHLDRSG